MELFWNHETHSPKANNTKAHRKGFAVQAAGDERSEVDLGHWSQGAQASTIQKEKKPCKSWHMSHIMMYCDIYRYCG